MAEFHLAQIFTNKTRTLDVSAQSNWQKSAGVSAQGLPGFSSGTNCLDGDLADRGKIRGKIQGCRFGQR